MNLRKYFKNITVILRKNKKSFKKFQTFATESLTHLKNDVKIQSTSKMDVRFQEHKITHRVKILRKVKESLS